MWPESKGFPLPVWIKKAGEMEAILLQPWNQETLIIQHPAEESSIEEPTRQAIVSEKFQPTSQRKR